MSEWRTAKLNDLCLSITDGDHQAPPKAKSGIPFITISNLDSALNAINFAECSFVPEEYYDSLSESRRPKRDDILYSAVGSFGIPILVKDDSPFVFQRHIAILRPNSNVCPAYLAYVMKSREFYHWADNVAIGAAQRTVTLKQLREKEITLPDVKTQERIAGVLSAYDELIENNRKQIKLLEEAAQRLYKEWFIDLRFPGYEAVPADTETGLPDGWKSVHLADIVSKVRTGLNPRKNFVLGQGSNYYITIKNMSNNDVYLDDRCDRVDDEAIELINRRSDLQLGDVLFSAVGTIGRVYLVSIPLGNWNVNESIFTLRANELVSKEFLYLLLLSFDLQQYCKANSHGVAQPGIRMADLKQFELKLPDAALMREFTAQVGPLIKLAQSFKENAKRLQEARDRLLPKLMSGEIEVS